MNICFLIYNFSRPGGSERVTSIIANELSKRGYNVHILSICGNNTSYYPLNDKVKIGTLFKSEKQTINHKLLHFNIMKRLKKYYIDNSIDLSIDVFASLSLYTIPLKKKLGIKNITWEHFNYTCQAGLNKYARKIACKYSDAIITLTNEDVEQYKANEKINCLIDFIYNPTPYPNAKKSDLLSKNVITVGRLAYEKGYDILLRMWSKVEKQNLDWNLNIYGAGEEEDNLKAQAQSLELKKINFCGVRHDIDKAYLDSSIYVSTSRSEGLPMCLIEAQSFGLPIVTFDYKTGPSEIVKNGANGYIIKNYDENEFISKLLKLMSDSKLLKEMASKSDVSKFCIDSIMNKWIDTINKIYERNGK